LITLSGKSFSILPPLIKNLLVTVYEERNIAQAFAFLAMQAPYGERRSAKAIRLHKCSNFDALSRWRTKMPSHKEGFYALIFVPLFRLSP